MVRTLGEDTVVLWEVRLVSGPSSSWFVDSFEADFGVEFLISSAIGRGFERVCGVAGWKDLDLYGRRGGCCCCFGRGGETKR